MRTCAGCFVLMVNTKGIAIVKIRFRITVIILSLMLVFCDAAVVPSHAATIRLNKKSLSMAIGEKYQLKVTGTKKKKTWSTTDAEVAKVSGNGKITAIAVGTATIKAKVAGKTLECKVQVRTKKTPSVIPYKKLIIDTDTGADDASALIFAAKCKSIDILGVTTLVGNTNLEQSTRNALMALELAGSDAPVYKGAGKTCNGKERKMRGVFGNDGMGDCDLIHPTRTAEEKDAVSFILETVAANPGEVEIVSLGPTTNIANAIAKDPATMKKVKRIWSMGTTGLGPGNASPIAEFNVFHDAQAYRIMLDSGIPVTVVGLDMCNGDAMWNNHQFSILEKSGEIGSFITKSYCKIREYYAKNGSPDKVNNCDAAAMMCCLDPDFVTSTVLTHASCITDVGETYGQVIFYKKSFTYDSFDVGMRERFNYDDTLVTEVDKLNYFNLFYDAIQ